jgi:hypothetical protein
MARRRAGERKSKEQMIAELIHRARETIGEGGVFVKPDRVIRKQDHLDPTEHQAPLLKWITRRGFVPFEETLGMHWGILGGLFSRGLVEWRTDYQRGGFGLAPRDRGF